MKRLLLSVLILTSIQANAEISAKNCRIGEVTQLTGTIEVQRLRPRDWLRTEFPEI